MTVQSILPQSDYRSSVNGQVSRNTFLKKRREHKTRVANFSTLRFKKVEPLTDDQLTELVLKCRTGKIDAYNELIERNIPLVFHLTKRYSRSGLHDDLFSTGLKALVEAVHKYPQDGELGAGIRKWIISQVGFAVRVEYKKLTRQTPYDAPQRSGWPSAQSMAQAKELREQLVTSELEDLVLDGKLDGLTNREIAAQSGLTELKVCRILGGLKQRLEFLRRKGQ